MAEINTSLPEGNNEEKNQPDFNLSDILSKLMPQSSPSENKIPPSESKGTGDLFSSILSNPELLSKLPQLISVIGPLMSSFSQNQSKSLDNAVPAQKIVESTPAISKPHYNSDSRAALLCAMKPYLCHDRQNAIDYIIKLSRLGEILKTL